MSDKESLEQTQSRLRETYAILEVQQQQIIAHQRAIAVLGETLIELHADAKITKIVASILLREAAGNNRNELNRLVSMSLARAECEAHEFSPSARSAVLRSIDEMMCLVEK